MKNILLVFLACFGLQSVISCSGSNSPASEQDGSAPAVEDYLRYLADQMGKIHLRILLQEQAEKYYRRMLVLYKKIKAETDRVAIDRQKVEEDIAEFKKLLEDLKKEAGAAGTIALGPAAFADQELIDICLQIKAQGEDAGDSLGAAAGAAADGEDAGDSLGAAAGAAADGEDAGDSLGAAAGAAAGEEAAGDSLGAAAGAAADGEAAGDSLGAAAGAAAGEEAAGDSSGAAAGAAADGEAAGDSLDAAAEAEAALHTLLEEGTRMPGGTIRAMRLERRMYSSDKVVAAEARRALWILAQQAAAWKREQQAAADGEAAGDSLGAAAGVAADGEAAGAAAGEEAAGDSLDAAAGAGAKRILFPWPSRAIAGDSSGAAADGEAAGDSALGLAGKARDALRGLPLGVAAGGEAAGGSSGAAAGAAADGEAAGDSLDAAAGAEVGQTKEDLNLAALSSVDLAEICAILLESAETIEGGAPVVDDEEAVLEEGKIETPAEPDQALDGQEQ